MKIPPELLAAWANVRDDMSPANWVICEPNTSCTEALLTAEGTTGWADFISHFTDDKILFGGYRCRAVDAAKKVSAKFIFVNWQGKKVSAVRRGKAGTLQEEFRQLFSGIHTSIQTNDKDDFNLKDVVKRVQSSAGAHTPTRYEFDGNEGIDGRVSQSVTVTDKVADDTPPPRAVTPPPAPKTAPAPARGRAASTPPGPRAAPSGGVLRLARAFEANVLSSATPAPVPPPKQKCGPDQRTRPALPRTATEPAPPDVRPHAPSPPAPLLAAPPAPQPPHPSKPPALLPGRAPVVRPRACILPGKERIFMLDPPASGGILGIRLGKDNVIDSVYGGSVADMAGLWRGWKIVAFQGTRVSTYEQLCDLVEAEYLGRIRITAVPPVHPDDAATSGARDLCSGVGAASIVGPSARAGPPSASLPTCPSAGAVGRRLQYPEQLGFVEGLQAQLRCIMPGSELAQMRSASWKQRDLLGRAQDAVRASRDPFKDGTLAKRDSARAAALHAQKRLVDALSAPHVAALLGKEGERLAVLEKGLVAARASGSPRIPATSGDRTDAATSLRLAEEKAKALQGSRAAPMQGEVDAAIDTALVALDACIGMIHTLGAERREAQSVLDELAEGCKAAEDGRFYERVRVIGSPQCQPVAAEQGRRNSKPRQMYNLMLTMKSAFPAEKEWKLKCAELLREAEEEEARAADAASVADLDYEADMLRTKIRHARPEDKAELDQKLSVILQQVRAKRKERTAEAVELLRLAQIHFPECIKDLCRGADEELRSLVLGKRPETLRLLVAGGRLTDYTPCPGPPLSRRHEVFRAESGNGLVVIKRVKLVEGALRTFVRGIVMMDAAGDAAAAVRCAFVDTCEATPYGCLVMESYPFTLADWAGKGRSDALSPAAILCMVQRLLGCLVRLHSATPHLLDAELAEGIIHGDVTPANIVVDAVGQPRFIDFEMARTEGPQSTMTPQGLTVDFAAPELLGAHGYRDPVRKATKKSDVYGMGATLYHILTRPHVRAAAGCAHGDLVSLCKGMKHGTPSARPTAAEALALSSCITDALDRQLRESREKLYECHLKLAAERDRVKREQATVQADQQKLEEQKRVLKAKSDAETEGNLLEQGRLQQIDEKLRAQSRNLAATEKKLDAEHKAVEAKRDALEQLKEAVHSPPKHWTGGAPSKSQGWRAVPVSDKAVFGAFRRALLKTRADWLGHGKDALAGGYSKLVLQRVWRIQNPILWKLFSIAREAVADALKDGRLTKRPLMLRQETAETLGPKATALPDELHHGGGVNEVRLFHGTHPGVLLCVLNDGLNERFSGSSAGTLFGNGVYFGEDPGKSDHYARPHAPGTAPDLERHLYTAGDPQPGTVFYVLVCRVVCGDYAVTQEGKTLSAGGALWATPDRRELVRSAAGDHHTSLLAETGKCIHRYREFVLFRGLRAYPEYLLAYTRE